MRILNSSILPPKIILFREGADDAGTATATATEEATPAVDPGKPGSAFSKMIKEMRPDDQPAETKETKETKEEKPTVADAGTKKEKAKKEPKKDPILEALSPTKAEEKKEEKTPEPDEKQKAEIDTATKGMTQKSADHFRSVIGQRDAAERRAAAAEAELKKIKEAGPQIPVEVKTKLERLEALEKDHAGILETMEKIGAERSPTYQTKFVKGRAALVERAKGLVQKFGGDPNAFIAALGLSGKERSEALESAMENMHAMDTQRVSLIVTEIESLDEEGASYLANARESLLNEEKAAQQIESARMKEVAIAREGQFTQVANTMLHRLPDDHPLAGEVNEIVDRTLADAKKFLFENSEFNDFAKAAIAHAMFPVMQQRLASAAQKIAELEAQLEEFTGADPSISNGGGGHEKVDDKGQGGLAGRYKTAMAG